MNHNHSSSIFIILLSIIITISSIHIEINNIHHGYKLILQGQSSIIQKQSAHPHLLITNIKWQLNQLQPQLIPFFNIINLNQAIFDLTHQLIQGVFQEQSQIILLTYKQNTSIVTTLTLKPNPDFPTQNLRLLSTIIKADCQWSQQAL